VLIGLMAGGLVAAGPLAPAQAAGVVIDTGFGVQAHVDRGGLRISLSRRGRPRRGRAIRREPPRPPASFPRPGLPAGGDRSCLAALERQGVPFSPAAPARGIATPIEVVGPIGGIHLLSRGRRAPLMDCELARSLARAAPFMRDLGITGLSFSSTYAYRTVRGSSKLSGHAHGLAIDVHAVETTIGHLDVERDYPKDPGRWRQRAAVPGCVGDPMRPEGHLLRTLACGLRTQRDLRLVITPDDNHDHRNHLHIEAQAGRSGELVSRARR
jgi:hypothetical protein